MKATARGRLLLLLTILAVLTTHLAPTGWNDTSRLATVESLVESGSLVIDQSVFAGTGDKVFINGHFYSDKPPMAAVMSAAVYLPLHALGIRLHLGRSLAYYLITLLTVKVFWLLGILAFYSALRFTGLDAEKRVLASLVLGVGSLYFSWSVTLNNHVPAAGCLAIGFYFLLKARFESHVHRDLGVAGLCLSLAGAFDMPTTIFFVLFFPYVLRDPRLRTGALWYVTPLALTLGPALAMTYAIHGSLRPVNIVQSYFEYPGSPWIGSGAMSGTQVNGAGFIATYALVALIGPRGFLLYNPFLGVALVELVRVIRRAGTFFYEALVIGSGSLVLVTYYLLTSNNYGGWSYSIRWFVPVLPLILFFLYPYFAAFTEGRARRFRVLLAVSAFIAVVGAANPWSDPAFSSVPLFANLLEVSTRVGRQLQAWLPGPS